VGLAALRTAECDTEDPIEKVEIALEHFRAGNFVLVMDAADREDEGDLILAAEKCEQKTINGNCFEYTRDRIFAFHLTKGVAILGYLLWYLVSY